MINKKSLKRQYDKIKKLHEIFSLFIEDFKDLMENEKIIINKRSEIPENFNDLINNYIKPILRANDGLSGPDLKNRIIEMARINDKTYAKSTLNIYLSQINKKKLLKFKKIGIKNYYYL